jgi:hypothetical protein
LTDPTGGLPRGRPTLFTPDRADRIVQVVAAGNYLKTAAQFCGISNATLMAWLARGRAAAALTERGEPLPASEVPFLEFLERVTQAETQAEVAAITHWRKAFSEDWRAARDYVARKRPEQWAAKTTVTISSEEADRRIEEATLQALTALGVDASGGLLGEDDPASVTDGFELPEGP